MDSKIIVSNIIDIQITSEISDIYIFKNFDEVIKYTESTPIRISKLYFTEDITKYNPSPAFNSLVKLVESVFFKTDEIIFITSQNNEDIKRIEFLINEKLLKDVSIIKGNIQKEFILSVIKGNISNKNHSLRRNEIIRHRRSEYIKGQKKSVIPQEDKVHTEEESLSQVDSQTQEPNHIFNYEDDGVIIQVSGLDYLSKSIFSVVLSQFLSGYGKTILFDTDATFFTVSYLLHQGKISFLEIPMKLYYTEPLEMINLIKESKEKLICITGTSEDKEKHFRVYNIINALFYMLKNDIDYFIFETELEQILPSFNTIIVLENNIISAIKTAYYIPPKFSDNLLFAALDSSINQISIKNSKVLSSIISEIIEKLVEVPIYRIENLVLEGGKSLDLYRYSRRNTKKNSNV